MMPSDDQALFLALLSLFAVAAVVLILALVLLPLELTGQARDASWVRRYGKAFARGVSLAARIVGLLILLLQASLFMLALAGSRRLANQIPGLEVSVLQVAVCFGLYWISSGTARIAPGEATDDHVL